MPTPTTAAQMKNAIDQAFNQKLGIANSITPVTDGDTLKMMVDYINTCFILSTDKAAALGVATLDASGKLLTNQLPSLSITDTYVVSSEAAMLALTAQKGDVAVRTDESKTYILTADPATTLSNWQEILTPSGGTVISVNGQTGAVTLTSSNITEGTNLYFTNSRAITALTGQNISIFTNDAGFITGTTLTGDVTGTGTSTFTTTIAANVVSNAKLATVATSTIKGRVSAGTGNVEDLSVSQVKTLLNLTGTNSGDITVSGENFISLSGQAITVGAVVLSGTNVSGTLPVNKGGTGVSSLTAYAPLFGGTTGTGAVQSGTVGTAGQVLTSNGPGALPTFQAPGTGSPGGTNTQLQYNNSGVLSGLSTFTTDGSSVTLSSDNILTTPTARLILSNSQAATNVAQVQYSPSLNWTARGWKTDSVAASQAVDFRAYVVPVTGTANPTGYITFGNQINGSGWTDNLVSISDKGALWAGSTPYYASASGYASNTSRIIGVLGAASGNAWFYALGGSGSTKAGMLLGNSTQEYGAIYWDNSTNNMIVQQRYIGGYLGFGANSRTTDIVIDASTGNVGINNSSPAASARLDISSTTKGFLMPRMTTTQKNAISSPAEGLWVYDLDLHAPCVYNGTAWKTVTIS